MHEESFLREEEVVRMKFVNFVFALLSIASCWRKRRGIGIERRHGCERIANDLAFDAKFVW